MIATSSIKYRRYALLIGLLPLFQIPPSSADENQVKVPFLFSEDEQLPQTDLGKMASSDLISADQYLSAPLTRLEYMLMMLESRLNEPSQIHDVEIKLTSGFENASGTAIIKGFVRYYPMNGKIRVGYRVSSLSRPKIPMRKTCDDVLSELEVIAPQGVSGFFYHNTVLGVLAQKDFSEYTESLDHLKQGIVHMVTLETAPDNNKAGFSLTCQRSKDGEPIVYWRSSFKLP